jgi:NADPH-ferrihemoprotein reductase
VVQDLVPYIKDPAQSEWVHTISKQENQAAYQGLCHEGKVSVSALVSHAIDSIQLPLNDFLNVVPFLKPRFYTISSSCKAHPHSIHSTIGVTRHMLPNGTQFHGVCSSYLSGLAVGSSCRVFLRSSSFKLPHDMSTPIIMIGPGTGIAPMRALLQERALQRSHLAHGAVAGPNTLYFGCRRRDEDYIYADELAGYEQSGVLDRLLLAFSRETSEKVYVQTLMRVPENAAAIVRDLERGAYVYVCGATAMGADVHEALIDIWSTSKGNNYTFIDILSISAADDNYYCSLQTPFQL